MTKAARFDEFDQTCVEFGKMSDLSEEERKMVQKILDGEPLPPVEESSLMNADRYVEAAKAAGTTERFDDLPEE